MGPSAVEDPGDGDLESFGEKVRGVAPRIRTNRRIGGGRGEGHQPQPRGDDLESQHVKAVGHEEHATVLLAREPVGDAVEGRGRARAGWQADDRAVGEPRLHEVASPDIRFTHCVACADSTRDQHHRGEATLVQRCRVVETRPEHGRRAPVVLGGAEDGDRVGRGRLVVRARQRHGDNDGRPPEGERNRDRPRRDDFAAQGPEGHAAIYEGGCGGRWRWVEDGSDFHQPPPSSPYLHRPKSISSNSASALESPDCPSQNSALRRTPPSGWERAIRIRAGPPASRGCWERAKTACSLTSWSRSRSSTRSARSRVAASPAAWPSQNTAWRRVRWGARSSRAIFRSIGHTTTESASVAGRIASSPARSSWRLASSSRKDTASGDETVPRSVTAASPIGVAQRPPT